MKYNKLGNSDLLVSEVCLGTMTWGMQNTEEEAHQQLEYAISRGVNFIDTAELYPIPPSAPGQVPGRTEQYIGTYLAKHPEVRQKLIIATKVVGYQSESRTAAYRYDPPKEKLPAARLDRQSILDACDASLRRLQTTYIDLYQLHWPDRYVPPSGVRGYDPKKEREAVPIKETLLVLKELLDAGKIRVYGLSNETSYGVCEFVRLADEIGMPRPVSIQNSFCLMNRQFESELAETCAPRNFNIGLLPWSILAGGVLSGKYNGKVDKDFNPMDSSLDEARFIKYRRKDFMSRYITNRSLEAVEKYMKIAKGGGISVATMAQAFCKTRWYIPSSIIGATKMEQLKENIDAFEIELSEEILEQIDAVHNENKDVVILA